MKPKAMWQYYDKDGNPWTMNGFIPHLVFDPENKDWFWLDDNKEISMPYRSLQEAAKAMEEYYGKY